MDSDFSATRRESQYELARTVGLHFDVPEKGARGSNRKDARVCTTTVHTITAPCSSHAASSAGVAATTSQQATAVMAVTTGAEGMASETAARTSMPVETATAVIPSNVCAPCDEYRAEREPIPNMNMEVTTYAQASRYVTVREVRLVCSRH